MDLAAGTAMQDASPLTSDRRPRLAQWLATLDKADLDPSVRDQAATLARSRGGISPTRIHPVTQATLPDVCWSGKLASGEVRSDPKGG